MNAKAKEISGEVIERDNSIATQSPPSVPAASEAGAIIDMIDRAARDSTVNIDKMRELLAMRKEIKAQEAEEAFRDALSLAQGEMRPIATDSNNPSTKSKYASYAALDRALRPIYTKHGFALSFNTEPSPTAGNIMVVCWVSCKGHKEKYQVDMPADGKGAKGGDVMTKTHATGSAMTYGQRYLLKMIFNIAVGADDDGNAASGAVITEDQCVALCKLIDDVGADIQRFCAIFNIDGVALLPASRFEEAKTRLQKFAGQPRGTK